VIPATGLVINLSSVQTPGVDRLKELGVSEDRLVSFHPLFGPVGVRNTGWVGKKIITTTPYPQWVVDPFLEKGVVMEEMTPKQHDEKMLPHAVAFLVGQFAGVGFEGMDDRYLTGSARHALGLLDFVGGSEELTELVLSNPALKGRWPAIKKKLDQLEGKFGWGE
jgi:prephenate dehydrogenase